MVPAAESELANNCVTCSLLRKVSKKEMFVIVLDFALGYAIKDSGKQIWFESVR
jgi:hypothetical protein